MKLYLLFVCCIVQVLIINSKVIPKRLPEFCRKSHSEYNECTTNVLKKMGPHLLKGVREINFPKMYPLTIPLFLVNRTISESVSITASIKDFEAWGYEEFGLKSFNFDTNTLTGELSMHLPYLRISYDFEISGRLLMLKLNNVGHFKGNFTNVDVDFKFTLQPVERLGVTYYEFKDFKAHGTVDHGHIQLYGKPQGEQILLDGIANFYNLNPSLVMDAVQPIYDESLSVFYRGMIEPVLRSIPAGELLPE